MGIIIPAKYVTGNYDLRESDCPQVSSLNANVCKPTVEQIKNYTPEKRTPRKATVTAKEVREYRPLTKAEKRKRRQRRKGRPRRRKSFFNHIQKDKDRRQNGFFKKFWGVSRGLTNAAKGIYTRTSVKDEKRGYSKECQVELATSYCQQRGFSNIRYFCDHPASGRKLKRPGLQALLAACQRGEIDTVIVTTPSRLSREPQDRRILAEYKEKYGIKFIAVYPERFAENIRRQDQYRRENNLPVGRTPAGKMINRSTRQLECDLQDWVAFKTIKDLRRNKSTTWREIATLLNASESRTKCGKQWTARNAGTFYARLQKRCPTIAGEL